MAAHSASSSRRWRTAASVAVALTVSVVPAYAQLDPTLFLKRSAPNVIVMLDTGVDMQRDAPTDPSCIPGASNASNCTLTVANQSSNYYDPFIYTEQGGGSTGWEAAIGVSGATVTTNYRRKYVGLTPSSGTNAYTATTITTVGDKSTSAYQYFEAPTRLSIARAAIYRAIVQNQAVARFGLYTMRQNNPQPATKGNTSPIVDNDSSQQLVTESGIASKWKLSMPTVSGVNGAYGGGWWGANSEACSTCSVTDENEAAMLGVLAKDTRTSGGLLPAGQDVVVSGGNWIFHRDRPVQSMLDDALAEANRLILFDLFQQQCRNTVVILVTSGGEGTTTAGADPLSRASTFLSYWVGRRVPIYIVAIAPPAADRSQLQTISTNSGGQYFEITKAEIDTALASPLWTGAAASGPANTVVVPEAVKAINVGIQAAFEDFEDLNARTPGARDHFWWSWFRWGSDRAVSSAIGDSEYQVTTPIIGTVNLQGAKDINGNTLTPDPSSVKDRAGNVIPERSNVMLTAAFTLPGFDGLVRAFRMYQPVVDSTQPTGWKFQSDGTPLWTACAPGTTAGGACASLTTDQRNLFTTLADGTMVPFTTAYVNQIAPLMNVGTTDATNIINLVRAQPFGTILDSTPAMMNPPSLDPPPDDTYPAFAAANANRRSLIFVGTNRGILEALDARLGVEVWGYIPTNLLPKLRTLWDGQAVGSTDFMMDGSPKISDIKLADGTWHTYLFMSQGAGGTFYQTFDVTMPNMATSVQPTDDTVTNVLSYFNSPTIVPLKWSFPLLADWDPTFSSTLMPYGDLKSTASTLEKTVGQTWSDPAIGQVQGPASPYVMLAGSGYLPYSVQAQTNRGGLVAGTTFYMFNAETGALLASKDVGSNGLYETQDNCTGTNISPTPSSDCTQFKNALHSDPVATGPADSRFITKAYIGDLDGRVWRFDIQLDPSNNPTFVSGPPTKLYDDSAHQPIFASMATVNVGGTQQYIFTGTGADLLPSNNVTQQYKLLGILDNGSSGTKTFEIDLTKVDNYAGDEKVTTFPAVAGDIVFFTTTTFNPRSPCTGPTASLYALTFIGGPAYDTNNDGTFSSRDSVLVKSVSNARGTAPFIVDQHLVFGTTDKVQIFGNDADYNNGIGQAGVRILSWREVR